MIRHIQKKLCIIKAAFEAEPIQGLVLDFDYLERGQAVYIAGRGWLYEEEFSI